MSCLYDIAAYAGATVVSEDLGMQVENTDPVQVVGKVSQAIIDQERTILIGGHGFKETTERIQFLENFIEGNVILGDFDKDVLSERISKLKGGIRIIQPGGRTKVEFEECRDRIEDSVQAVRAAMEQGYVPGGGMALVKASEVLD